MPEQRYTSLKSAMAAIQRAQHAEDIRKAKNLRRSAGLAKNRTQGSGPRIAR